MKEPTHASFFSGVGGLDLGLERAGWRTVSFSEIDPYASAVLAERWPGIPNLGDIVSVAAREGGRINAGVGTDSVEPEGIVGRVEPWHGASLWTGGFPCQDLSVAGKRRGMVEGTRSNLAHAFLDLVERHRPPAIILENVPGLLSSHAGRDLGALLGRLAELGYVGAYRVLDARYFGVPQRRRRVFIVALDAGRGATADDAAEVLSVGSRCDRHPATGGEARAGAADRFADGIGGAGELNQSVTAKWHKGSSGPAGDEHHNLLVSPPLDAGGVRAPHGLAGRVDDRQELARAIQASAGHHGHSSPRGDGGDNLVLAPTLNANKSGGWRYDADQAEGLQVVPFVKRGRAQTADDGETWGEGDVAPTLNGFDVGDTRTTAAILGTGEADDPFLPDGLDSHRYRCCGNGVVAPVAEWIGRQLLAAL